MLGPSVRASSCRHAFLHCRTAAHQSLGRLPHAGRSSLLGLALTLHSACRRGRARAMKTVGRALVSLQRIAGQSEQSWLERLSADPETQRHAPNQSPREVTSGHYVEVFPTPLKEPELVVYSPEVAELLQISEEEVKSDAFKAFFSGDQAQVPELRSWCTPYALAIMGQRMVSNCPFGNGNGYGDGRAISVGELVTPHGRQELQLKGAGRTPFCRGGDGRAVLRSSVREFLASEAMWHLGVDTTRALCLVVSGRDTARRAWYSGGSRGREPDMMVDEACAISTRVAPSFLRVGHVDLFARRAARDPEAMGQLEQMVEHLLFREYPHIFSRQESLKEKAVLMLEEFPERLGRMVAGWLRVGFCQGNFNSDNCLVGGRTMDYGPFGFIERYEPLFAKWTGSGEHYGFLNQPQAAIANFHTLLTSVAVLLDDEQQAVKLLEAGAQKIREACQEVFSTKLGFSSGKGRELWQDLEPLMRSSKIDYTIFWRQLANVLEHPDEALEQIEPAFYQAPDADAWRAWLSRWADAVVAAEGDAGDATEVVRRLREVNPKYVPREWILVEAYEKAAEGDYSLVKELLELFRRPYDEQPQYEERFYRRTPPEAERGGISVMT